MPSPIGKTLSTEDSLGIHPESKNSNSGVDDPSLDKDSFKNLKKDWSMKYNKEFLNPSDHKSAQLSLLGKRFKIEDVMLGVGSFGRTYLGRDIKRSREVAIKIVRTFII